MGSNRKNLLTVLDYEAGHIRTILHEATRLKRERSRARTPASGGFAGKTAVMFFEKPSLRTRITFETAVNELGGHPVILPPDSVRIGRRETIPDVARNMERWVHLFIARTFRHDTLVQFAGHSSIPVINALSDAFHPCQALAFAMTLDECGKTRTPPTVVFVGDSNNVCNSLMALCAKLGYPFIIACPNGYDPQQSILDACMDEAARSGGNIRVSHDPGEAVREASAIYTDVWASMGQEHEAEKRKRVFQDFQVTMGLVKKAPPAVVVSHCLPAHRGEEITDEVLDASFSIAFDEAENRLHVQKAVIANLFPATSQQGRTLL